MAAKNSGRDLTEAGEGQLTLRAGDREDGRGKDLKWRAGSILSAALVLGFETSQLKFHHLH